MIKIIYNGEDLKEVKKEVLKAFNFSYKFFKLNLSKVVIHVSKTMAEYNKILKRKTLNWEVGNTTYNNQINILGSVAMQNESCHDKIEFSEILRHEFTHLFINKLTRGKVVPR